MKRLRSMGCFIFAVFVAATSLFLVFHFFKQTPSPSPSFKVTQVVVPSQTTTPAPCTQKYENGIAFPEWSTIGYSESDVSWQRDLLTMKEQTHACWVEMPLLFHQTSRYSTDVVPGDATPSVQSFIDGVVYAHNAGLRVFVTILLGTGDKVDPWSGVIQLDTLTDQQSWFDQYVATIQPYLIAAQQNHVEQLAMGNELNWMQRNAPSSLWENMLQHIRAFYTGTLTYDANWDSLFLSPPAWMKSTLLSFIGISAYVPVVKTRNSIDPKVIPQLWRETVQQDLDRYARKLGRPVLISEIGYRQAHDALFDPWNVTVTGTRDPQTQAAACGAVVADTMNDPLILGVFYWGWGKGVGGMDLENSPAAQTIDGYYQQVQKA